MSRKITVKVCTPLPIPIAEIEGIGAVARSLALAMGHPTDRIWMNQTGDDLTIWFTLGDIDHTENFS